MALSHSFSLEIIHLYVRLFFSHLRPFPNVEKRAILLSGTPQRGFFIISKVSASSIPVIWRPKNLCISLSFLVTGLIPRLIVEPVSSVRLKNFFR